AHGGRFHTERVRCNRPLPRHRQSLLRGWRAFPDELRFQSGAHHRSDGAARRWRNRLAGEPGAHPLAAPLMRSDEMKLTTHLVFDGCCEEAFRFYERILRGKIVAMLTYGRAPMGEQVAPEWRDKIVHATMTVGSTVLNGADVPPDQYKTPQG